MKRILTSLFLFLAVLALFLTGISSVSDLSEDQQLESLSDAVHRSIVHCYATEGRYPESLSELTSRYGITYDDSRYFIDYQPVGSNIMPDVTIIARDTR